MASWYYVDPAGATKGPHTIAQLKPLYGSVLKDTTYIWNGTTVAQWTALNKVPDIWKQIKPQPAPPKPSPPQPGGAPKVVRRRRRRRSPFGGGGRAALLAGIQRGTKLKKTEAPKEKGPGGSGPSGGGKKGGGRPLSLMEQMKLAQQNRKGGNKKRAGGGVKPKPKPKPSPATSSAPKMTWKEKQEAKKREAEGGGGGSHGSLGHRKDKIVTKLKNAQEWQLKAIEAILK